MNNTSTSINDFESTQNKELLWEILCENQTFRSKIKVDINKLTQEFENNMKITRQNNNNLNLVDLNKQFIHIMNSSCSNGTIFNISNEPITSQDIQNKNISEFEKRLNNRQSEFDNSMKNTAPDDINFKDDKDMPISDIDNILKQKIAERKYDSDFTPSESIEDAAKWIGIDVSNNSQTNLNTTSIQDLDFSTNDDNFGDFFSKLKNNNDTSNDKNINNSIENKIDTIIQNQNNIISMLNQILNK
jgi:hypothetical protein